LTTIGYSGTAYMGISADEDRKKKKDARKIKISGTKYTH